MNELREKIRAARYPAALTARAYPRQAAYRLSRAAIAASHCVHILRVNTCARIRWSFSICIVRWWAGVNKSPNAAHYALSELNVRVITQNIDGLHARAGSTDAIEMHGSLRFVLCPRCGWQQDSAEFARRSVPHTVTNRRAPCYAVRSAAPA